MIVLQLTKPENFSSAIDSMISALYKDYSEICYISLAKPFSTIIRQIKQRNLDTTKFIVLDTQTKNPDQFIGVPENLTDVSINFSDALKRLKDNSCVLIDNISLLLVYNDTNSVISFIQALIAKSRNKDISLFMLITHNEDSKSLAEQLIMFVDEVNYSS